MKHLKTITIALVIYSLVLLSVACPKRSVLDKAARASYRLNALTGDIIDAVGKAYQNGNISLETKNKAADALLTLSKAELAFVQAVREAEVIIETTGSLPKERLFSLDTLFNDTILVPFFKIVEILTPYRTDEIQAAVKALRVSVLIIANSFSKT